MIIKKHPFSDMFKHMSVGDEYHFAKGSTVNGILIKGRDNEKMLSKL